MGGWVRRCSVSGVDAFDSNPDALLGGQDPVSCQVSVGATVLYVEERGSGPAVLLIGAADEDAEFYRGIADRLSSGCRVVTYDRRGTRRSGREGWPCHSARHGDDAADLITSLGLEDVTVLGASAGGVVALRLALRHPDLVRNVLCFEPGIFQLTEEGRKLEDRGASAVEQHLDSHPGDWIGAVDALGRAAVSSLADVSSLFTPPIGREWFAQRADENAEALIRGDLPITREHFDRKAVADCQTNLRFAYGSASHPVFHGIAAELAASRSQTPDRLEGLGHGIYHHPDTAASYILGSL
jgi:pimeloyl-ACP methyl ester carboxylesterase